MNNKFLLLLWGAPAAGKSTLAQKMIVHYRANFPQLTYLSSDAVSRTLFGDAFVGSMRPAIYETISLLAQRALAANLPVVIDGTYLNREAREQLRQLAETQGATFLSLLVHCPLELRQQRNANRSQHERVPANWVQKAHWAAEFQKREAHLVLETGSRNSNELLEIATAYAERRLRRVGAIRPKSTRKPQFQKATVTQR